MNRELHITRYEELPDIPLLLDQVLLLANQALAGLAVPASCGQKEPEPHLTSSMVNNYVKSKLVPAPVKKRYGREHVSQLVWVCLLKQVMDLKDIDAFFKAVLENVPLAQAYDGFCDDVEALLGTEGKPSLPLDELVLAAAQAVAARVRLLELVAQVRPANPKPGKHEKEARKKQDRDRKQHARGKDRAQTPRTPAGEGDESDR